jgi:hypothetical protein
MAVRTRVKTAERVVAPCRVALRAVSEGEPGRCLAARAIRNERHRAQALAVLAPRLSGETRVREIRQCLVSILDAQLTQGTCSEVLKLVNKLVNLEVLRWPIVGPDTVAVLARHIVETGHRWRWL